jgi:hypothetical protein
MDRDRMCPVEGGAMIGGWHIGKAIAPDVVLGGGLGVGVAGGEVCAADHDDIVLPMTMLIGPSIDWYPFDAGLHLNAFAGLAGIERSKDNSTYGVGAAAGIGYDWAVDKDRNGKIRFGFVVQAMTLRTTAGHAQLVPALLMTIGAGTNRASR